MDRYRKVLGAIVSLFLLLISCPLVAQTTDASPSQGRFLKMLIKVVDKDTSEPLPAAMLKLKNHNWGAVANMEGVLEFKFPPEYAQDTVVVTMVGYHSFYWPLIQSTATSTDTSFIRMNENPVKLEEVTVRPDEPSAKELMEQAMDRISQNYPKEPFILKGFFRDLKLENEEGVFLLEAAVRIYDKKFHKAPRIFKDLQERVAIDKMRATQNYIDQKEWKQSLSQENALTELLGNNLLRYQYGPFKLKDNLNYKRTHEVRLDSQLLYVIQVPSFPETEIYIDSDTYAVQKFVYKSQNERILEDASDSTHRVITDQYIQFEFQEYKEKLYLKYLLSETKYEERNKQTGEVLHTSELKLNLMITEVLTEDIKQLSGKETMDKYHSLETQKMPYDEDFWEGYNIIKETPVNAKIIADLRKRAKGTRIFSTP